MPDLKETILGTLANGPEVLRDRAAMRRNGKDYRSERFKTHDLINQIHPEKLELRVTEIRDETDEAKTIRFASKTGYLPVFEAGQYINIFVEIDGVRTSRPYSISSSPKQRAYFEITVTRIAQGFVSDYMLDKLKVGDELAGNGPAGTFHYNPVFHSKKSIFLAGGSGITPFMSMTREALESGADRELVLIYGSRTQKLTIFDKELTELASKHLNFSYTLVLSEPEAGYSGKTGFIDAACIEELAGDVSLYTFYMCGPTVMTDFCMKELESLEIRKSQIRREMFGSRQDIQNEPGWPENLTGNEVFRLKVGNKVVTAKANEPILTALERAGIRVNVCCRSGECSFCRVKLVSGKVFMPRGVLLRLADEKFGYIHSCKAYPIEDLEIGF